MAGETSVAEPPLFWVAPAPGGQGPGADSSSDLLGSAPGKKRRLQAAPAPYTKIFHYELLKSELLKQVYFGPYSPLVTAFKVMFDTRTRLFFFAVLRIRNDFVPDPDPALNFPSSGSGSRQKFRIRIQPILRSTYISK